MVSRDTLHSSPDIIAPAGSQSGTPIPETMKSCLDLVAARTGLRTMFHATMSAAIDGARTLAQMDELSRQVWQAHANGAVTDSEAQGLAERLHERRSAIRAGITPVGIPAGRVSLFPLR